MTHPTDFRTLCAELLEQLGQDWDDEISAPLAARASAALAAPQQRAPSDEDILYLAQSLKLYAIQAVEQGPIIYDIERQALLDLVRLALTRYGAQAVPVAVVEPDYGSVLLLAAIIREVDGSNKLGAAPLAEAILSHRAITGALPLPEALP
jgi:hypothetical protein